MIDEILNDHVGTMTEYQHDHFVTGMSSPTAYGQYKQAVKELYSRICGLRDTVFGKQMLEIEIDEQHHIANNDPDEFSRRKAEVRARQKEMALFDLVEDIKGKESEAMSFYRQAAQLKEVLGDISPERRKVLEAEMWEAQCKKIAALDVLSNGSLSQSVLEMTFSMKGEQRNRLLEKIKEPKLLLEDIERDTEASANLINGKQYPKLDFRKLIGME